MIEMEQLTLTDYQDIKQEIKNNLQNIVVSFVEIGFYLKQIRDNKMYLEDDYKDIWEFAAGEYKLDRTAASRFMSINDKYSIGGNSKFLQEQYQGFGKSTLTEMLTLPVEDHELITPETKVEDIRELKRAEKEQEEENAQIEGQESILSLMPDVVPESEKPKPQEVTITDVIRELFRPREMKEQLDALVNMDPESSAMDWWVNDFNQTGNRTFKKAPFFLFFYPKSEGVKIKNIKEHSIQSYTYTEFYFVVRAAFGQETVHGTDIWNQAFGAEYEAEQQAKREEEQRQKEEEQRKKEIEKQREERQRRIKQNQEKPAISSTEKPEKEIMEQPADENAVVFNKIKENSDSDNEKEVVDNDIAGNETKMTESETETPEIVTGIVEDAVTKIAENDSQNDENSVCDIALIPKSAIMTSLERAKWVKGHTSSPRESHAITVDADTYQDIITGWKRFIVLEYKSTDGETLTIYNGENKPIKAIVINYEYIPEGNGIHISGFEVLDYGQEE